MRANRYLHVFALVSLASGLTSRPASATYNGYDLFGSYLQSAMTVECLGGSLDTRCTSLGFRLDVQPPNDHRVLGVALIHTSPLWDFQQVLSVTNADGAAVSWTTQIYDTNWFELAIAYSWTSPQREPLYIEMGLNAASTGTAAQMQHVFGYGAKGYQSLNGKTKYFTKGVATPILPPTSTVPEPISMALLGTGLAGVGLVRRRRRHDEASAAEPEATN